MPLRAKACALTCPPSPPSLPILSTWNPAFDKPNPTAADSAFGCNCGAYAAKSCCTSAYTAALRLGPGALYTNWSFNQCGRTMSPQCTRFFQDQECNFGCSYPQAAAYSGGTGVPLCKSYADAWFAACANDFTCASNWNAWPNDPAIGYSCKPPSAGYPFVACNTFANVYGSAQAMIQAGPTALWGTTYSYSTDTSVW